MEIIVDKENKLVEVWLSREESTKPETDILLKPLYAVNTRQKYKTVVFRSGSANLSDCIEALIRHNMIRFAEEDMSE